MSLSLTPVKGIPLVQPGDSIAQLLIDGLRVSNIDLQDGDILVLAQKIVSKSEGRLVNLNTVIPTERAQQLALECEKDARFVELVLRESNEVLRTRPGTIVVEHRQGFVCANAGIDHSNVCGPDGPAEEWFLLLPEDADRSASEIRNQLLALAGKNVGVLIIDSHGRAWRMGTVGVSIGMSGVPGLVDMRGKPDIFGYQLRVTVIAAADELAAAASLVMGQADERIPAVHVRGFPYPLVDGRIQDLIRPKEMDLFR